MKVLVIGHQGMLAQELCLCLAAAGFAVVSRGRPEVDITQTISVRQTLAATQPAILINAAAYTAVDQAETEPDMAFAVNRDGVAQRGRSVSGRWHSAAPRVHRLRFRRVGFSSLLRR